MYRSYRVEFPPLTAERNFSSQRELGPFPESLSILVSETRSLSEAAHSPACLVCLWMGGAGDKVREPGWDEIESPQGDSWALEKEGPELEVAEPQDYGQETDPLERWMSQK